jgi:hypothetical protein
VSWNLAGIDLASPGNDAFHSRLPMDFASQDINWQSAGNIADIMF